MGNNRVLHDNQKLCFHLKTHEQDIYHFFSFGKVSVITYIASQNQREREREYVYVQLKALFPINTHGKIQLNFKHLELQFITHKESQEQNRLNPKTVMNKTKLKVFIFFLNS